MKKFIIAICGICFATVCLARDALTPKLVDGNVRDKWGASTDFNKYSTDVFSKGATLHFAPDWQFDTKAGTFGTNNEGSIVAIIATDVWENGGHFCTRQIQSAWSGSKDWIDYYENSKYKCKDICRPGYSGTKCAEHKFACDNSNVNYLNDLNDVYDASLRMLDGKTDGNVTENTHVFYYKNDYSEEQSYVMLLGVLQRKQHSVLVAPVRVLTDEGDKITSARSNGSKILLCAPGYDKDGDDCKLSSYCENLADLCDGENLDLFDETKNHEWATKIENGKSCKYITCKSGYGLDPNKTDKTCIPCATTRKQGVNSNGECKQCGDNEVFNNGNCDKYKQLSKHDLLDGFHNIGKCWMKSNPSEYKKCVLCQSDQTYNDEAKTCQ